MLPFSFGGFFVSINKCSFIVKAKKNNFKNSRFILY